LISGYWLHGKFWLKETSGSALNLIPIESTFMKSIRSLIIIFFLGLFLVIYLESVQAQTGNQSDTTGPDPQEFMNQSDTTGNDPQEIIIPINNNNNTNNNNNNKFRQQWSRQN
jgi:hypothetical protein